MNDVTERWLPVAGYEGLYEVSDQGRVRSLDRIETVTNGPKRFIRRRRGRLLRPLLLQNCGYLFVRLSRDSRPVSRTVHTLVLETFIGPRQGAAECRHLNGDRTDNRLPNLAWGTKSQNTLDQVAHNTHRNSRKTHCPQGHEYDYVTPEGRRQCKRCRRRHQERRRTA